MLETKSFVLILLLVIPVLTFPFVITWIKRQKDGIEHLVEMGKYAIQADQLIKMTEEDGVQRAALLVNCAHMLAENPSVTPESKRNVAFQVIAQVSATEYEAEGEPVPKIRGRDESSSWSNGEENISSRTRIY